MFAYSIASGADADGFGVITDRFLCLLGPEATAAIAHDVYRRLDTDDADLTDILDVLTSVHDLVRFAVVELLDPVSRNFAIAVRGKVSLELEQASATRLSGASDAAWISTEARGVKTLRLMLDDDEEPLEQLPIRRGVVVTRYVRLDDPAAKPPRARAATKPQAAARLKPAAKPASRPQSKSQPAPAKKAQASSKPSLATAVALEATTPAPVGSDWVLTLPDGSQVEVGLPIVVGRRPWSAEPPEREVVHVVAPASRHEISGTHLELSVTDGVVVARDLDSTNGTVVRATSRAPRLLHSGGTTPLAAGDILDIGEDFSIALSARE